MPAEVPLEAGAVHGKAGRRATVSDWMEIDAETDHESQVGRFFRTIY